MPVLVNALYVRYATGFTWVTDGGSIATYGRREDFVSLGGVESLQEAQRLGAAILDRRVSPPRTVSAGVEPGGAGDEPFGDFDVGDYVTAPDEDGNPESVRVASISVTTDGEGNPAFAAELDTSAFVLEQTLQRWLKAMANGTVGGTVASASPPPPAATAGGAEFYSPSSAISSSGDGRGQIIKELPPFNLRGAVVVGLASAKWKAPVPVRLTSFALQLNTASSSGSVVIDVLKNGATATQLTIPAGSLGTESAVPVVVDMGIGDLLQFQCTSAGTGAVELLIHPRYA